LDDLLLFHTESVERPVVVKLLTIINITEAVPHQVAGQREKTKQTKASEQCCKKRERETEQPGRLFNVCVRPCRHGGLHWELVRALSPWSFRSSVWFFATSLDLRFRVLKIRKKMAKYKKCQYSVLYRQYTHRIIILQKLLYEEPFTTVRPQLYFNFDLEKNGVG
jgi:hypothetical protein